MEGSKNAWVKFFVLILIKTLIPKIGYFGGFSKKWFQRFSLLFSFLFEILIPIIIRKDNNICICFKYLSNCYNLNSFSWVAISLPFIDHFVSRKEIMKILFQHMTIKIWIWKSSTKDFKWKYCFILFKPTFQKKSEIRIIVFKKEQHLRK